MKKIFSAETAGSVLLIGFSLLTLFHVFGLLGYIPADFIWGGRAAELPISTATLEFIAMVTAVLFMIIIAAKIGLVKTHCPKIVGAAVWGIFGFLMLNLIGNLFALSALETEIFTPITFVMALCAFRLAIEK